jgi:hypothetical protein
VHHPPQHQKIETTSAVLQFAQDVPQPTLLNIPVLLRSNICFANFDIVREPKDGSLYEYAVLVTSLPDEILALGQHYRNRADAEKTC